MVYKYLTKKNLIEDIIKKEHYHIRINSNNKNLDIKYMKAFTELLYIDCLLFGNNVKTDDLNLNEDDKLILNLSY